MGAAAASGERRGVLDGRSVIAPGKAARRHPPRDLYLVTWASSVLLVGLLHSIRPAHPPMEEEEAPPASVWVRHTLAAVAEDGLQARAQPARCRPSRIATTPDGRKAYVTLAGKEVTPGQEVAVLDVPSRRELRRIRVGGRPFGLALHPTGRWLVVANRHSNFLSVIDVRADRVVSEIAVPFYCEDLVFAADGTRAYVSNFWLDQVLVVDLREDAGRLVGDLRRLGFDREGFLAPGGVRSILRRRCGTSTCHLYPSGGFDAGPDADRVLASALLHSEPGDPEGSPLLQAAISSRHGGRADGLDGGHHPGGVVFQEPGTNPEVARIREWIRAGRRGPGIDVGEKPRNLLLSPDGGTLYVANTGSLDVSVVDLDSLREARRIFTRSPVNDLAQVGDRLVLTTLGVGSGHPKARHSGQESEDPEGAETEFTLFRDLHTGRPLPLSQQRPLGPYDDVDGTAQEKFRDITNDLVLLDPAASNVAAYAAEEAFTRYTSDSFEALAGDRKGDVPGALMKVVGAFPEQIAQVGDRLYVTMSGTLQVQEWAVDLAAAPAERLRPGRVFETGLKPTGIAASGRTLLVADELGETITFLDVESGETQRLSLSRQDEPFPATDFERGELFVQTSVFSVDQDQSCVHCHYRDTSDGKRWSVSQVMGQSRDGEERTGGSREVPDLRNLRQEVPFFLEGTLSLDEPLTMMMEHNPLVDFQGRTPAGDFDGVVVEPGEEERYGRSADSIVVATGKEWGGAKVRLQDLIKRRELHFRRTSERYLGRAHGFRELQRFIGAYQGGETRLLPNPEDPEDPEVRRGRSLFHSPGVGCSQCHPPPSFTEKAHVHNSNRAFFPMITPAARDNVHTLISADRIDHLLGFVRPWDPEDRGRVEEREGFFVAPSLRGLWARPSRFLHHGGAVSLREVLCTPGHPALRPVRFPRPDAPRPAGRERGMNEHLGTPDTHGMTSHLSRADIRCLERFVRSIE